MLGRAPLGTLGLGVDPTAGASTPAVSVVPWARHVAPCQSLAVVRARHAAPVASLGALSARHVAPLADRSLISARHAAPLALLSSVTARLVAPLTLRAGNPVAARHVAPLSLPDETPVIVSGQTRLLHQGRVLPLAGTLEISCDAGSPTWLCAPELAEAADYARVRLGDALTLDLYGTTFALVCDGRSLSIGEDGVPRYTLSALSPVALLGAPWAEPVTLGASGMARAVVEDLLGQGIDWRLVDWRLPDDAVSLEGTPLELARTLVGAVGGLLESAPDGSLIARPAYPVSPPQWAGASAVTLTDRDRFSHRESAEAVDRRNRYVITSGSAGAAADQIQIASEPVEGDPHAYRVRAYPYPWRPVTLGHTGDSATQIGARAELTIEHRELIEITGGSGSVQYPVDSLISAQYQHQSDGAVRADGTAITTAGGGYALVWITYRTRAWSWTVTNARDETIQFLAIE